MDNSPALVAGVSVFVVLCGLLGVAGLVAAAFLGTGARRGRAAAMTAFGAVAVLVGLMGSLVQGYTVRIGGSGPGLMDAGNPTSGAAKSGGFAFPLGALAALAVLAALLSAAAKVFRAPLGVVVPGLGWLAVVAALMYGGGHDGDVILAATQAGQLYFYGGLVIAFGLAVLAYQWQLTDRLTERLADKRPSAGR